MRAMVLWGLILVALTACSPDPQPVRAARYLMDGLADNDESRIERGLCMTVQENPNLMVMGPLITAYQADTLPDFERREVRYKVLTAETYEAVVEIRIPDQPNYYLLSTVEDRGWCICGDMRADEWNDNQVRGVAIQQCRTPQLR